LSCSGPDVFYLPKTQKTYIGPGFEIKLPKPGMAIKEQVNGNRLSVDFFAKGPLFSDLELYSLEWTSLSKRKDLGAPQFLAWMREYLPEFLSKNFGNGSYQASTVIEGRNATGLTAVSFAAFGTHNGGKRGACYGTMVNFGHHLAVFYLLTDNNDPYQGKAQSNLSAYKDMEKFVQFAEGFRCHP